MEHLLQKLDYLKLNNQMGKKPAVVFYSFSVFGYLCLFITLIFLVIE